MSLTDTNTFSVVKKQLFYKFKASLGIFISLVSAQIFAFLLSFNGISQMGASDGALSIDVQIYSGEIIIGFTLIWAFVIAITLTTTPYRNFDFNFITNRLTSNLSNIAFILPISLIGSITAILSGILLKVIIYLRADSDFVAWEYFMIPPHELLLSIYVTFLYLILASAIGYLMGMTFQFFKLFVLIIPMIIFVFLRARGPEIFQFILNEDSVILFTGKVLLTVTLLFASSILLTNRMEVRK